MSNERLIAECAAAVARIQDGGRPHHGLARAKRRLDRARTGQMMRQIKAREAAKRGAA